MKKIIEIIKENKIILIMLIISIIKILIVRVQPLYVQCTMKYDDKLMIDLANSIINGDWLGKYNHYTLIKGVFTPLFIALNYTLKIPFLLAKELLYSFACFIFIIKIKKVIQNKKLLMVLFTILLFNPVEYSRDLCRGYRDSIYLSLVLICISYILGIYLNIKEKNKVNNYIGFGISFTSIYLCREETIWICPFVAFFTIITIHLIIKQKEYKKLVNYIIPITIFIVSVLTICLINYKYYGVFTLNQYWGKDFKKAYGAIVNVRESERIDRVPVTRETMDRIAENSDKFKEIKDYIDNYMRKEEISGAYFHWALMEAVEEKGYYKDAKTANNYYNELANEINDACDNGKLSTYKEHYESNTPYYNLADLLDVAKKVPNTIDYQISLKYIELKINRINRSINAKEWNEEIFSEITKESLPNDNNYIGIFNSIRINVLELIKKVYSIINPIIWYLSIACYLGLIIEKRKIDIKNEILIILSGLLCVYLCRIFIVTYTAELMYESALNYMYLSSIYSIQFIFSFLSIVFFTKEIKKRINSIGEKDGERTNHFNTSIK